MLILKSSVKWEISIKNSRFLAELTPIANAEAARESLRSKKAEFQDATHVVHAFVSGAQGNIMGCSDDGEPPGTAGRPALEVLKNSGLTNVILTIARWFGGTKLGTGGLVKAYTLAAQEVLKICEAIPLVATRKIRFSVSYSLYEIMKRQISEFDFQNITEKFGDEVVFSGEISEEKLADFENQLVNLTKGHGKIILEENEDGR